MTTITIHPDYERWRDILSTLPRRVIPEQDIFYRGRNTLYTLDIDGNTLVVKSFDGMSALNRRVFGWGLRRSKAQRSYDNATRLLAAGINTPAPVAVIDVVEGGRLSYSAYVCRQCVGHTFVDWERDAATREHSARRLASMVLALHGAGVFHRDLAPGNVMIDEHGNLALIDLNRIKWGDHSDNAVFSMLERLTLSNRYVGELATQYAVLAGREPVAFAQRAHEHHSAHWRFRRTKRRIKAMLVPGTTLYPPEESVEQ